MEALRQITTIQNGIITFQELERWNNQEVEVIVLPLAHSSAQPQTDKFLQFAGTLESPFSDTSEHVDELLYGK